MLNAISAGIYRIHKSRIFWCCILLSVLLTAALYYVVYLAAANKIPLETDLSPEMFERFSERIDNTTIGQLILNGEITPWNQILFSFSSGSNFQFIVLIGIAFFVGGDVGIGMKYMISKGLKRSSYYISTFICSIYMTILIMVTSLLTSFIIVAFTVPPDKIFSGFNLPVLSSLLLHFLLYISITSVAVMIVFILRNTALVIILCILGINVVSGVLLAVDFLFPININMSYLFPSNAVLYINSANITIDFAIKLIICGMIYIIASCSFGMRKFINTDI